MDIYHLVKKSEKLENPLLVAGPQLKVLLRASLTEDLVQSTRDNWWEKLMPSRVPPNITVTYKTTTALFLKN